MYKRVAFLCEHTPCTRKVSSILLQSHLRVNRGVATGGTSECATGSLIQCISSPLLPYILLFDSSPALSVIKINYKLHFMIARVWRKLPIRSNSSTLPTKHRGCPGRAVLLCRAPQYQSWRQIWQRFSRRIIAWKCHAGVSKEIQSWGSHCMARSC